MVWQVVENQLTLLSMNTFWRSSKIVDSKKTNLEENGGGFLCFKYDAK